MDPTASIRMCSRQGLGKVWHIDVQVMWIQQWKRSGDLDLYEVLGEESPADIIAKATVSRERTEMLLEDLRCPGESAPELRTEGGSSVGEPGPGGPVERSRITQRAQIASGHALHAGSPLLCKGRWSDMTDEELDAELTQEVVYRVATWMGMRGLCAAVPAAPVESVGPPCELLQRCESMGAANRGRASLSDSLRRSSSEGGSASPSPHAEGLCRRHFGTALTPPK